MQQRAFFALVISASTSDSSTEETAVNILACTIEIDVYRGKERDEGESKEG